MSALLPIFKPDRTSPSGMLGVTTLARGKSALLSVSTASFLIRADPLVDTMTGSTTTCHAP